MVNRNNMTSPLLVDPSHESYESWNRLYRDLDHYNELHRQPRVPNLRLGDARIKRRLIRERGKACERCPKRNIALEMHHVIPVTDGGTSDDGNLLLLCAACHLAETRKWRLSKCSTGRRK